MRFIICTLIVLIFSSCGQDKRPILGSTDFQRKINAEFKDATTSPLKDKDRKNFSSLEFFEVDSSYTVKAKLERTQDSEWFKMKTTTSRLTEERIYGILAFELKGKLFQLNVYQGKDLMAEEEFKDYLFLPFLDDSNGEETYGGGRYMDLRIPEGDSINLDFNMAYNPYCVYNEKFSCPLVPRENYLATKIFAGVKMFKKK
ncbi:MAG: DUF1684 domain-containing protein [Flavobacteriaceae bacterium]|nr:MAG: DUF1684 domain-containing protein [Flavobacteriaceae bacterium]